MKHLSLSLRCTTYAVCSTAFPWDLTILYNSKINFNPFFTNEIVIIASSPQKRKNLRNPPEDTMYNQY